MLIRLGPCGRGVLCLAFFAFPAVTHGENSDSTKIQGCPLDIAVQQVDKFVDDKIYELSSASRPLIEGMGELMKKATKQGVAVGNQLSPIDVQRFNDLRHKTVTLNAEKAQFSNLKRDVHVISAIYDVAKLYDMFDLDTSQLDDVSPLKFYLSILGALRNAQPRVSLTTIVSVGIDCDPEAGLYFEESFNQQELAKDGANQRIVNMIFDIERIRTLYQLSWNAFDKGMKDLRAITWTGDKPNMPESIGPWVSSSSAAIQNMYKTVIPFIDKNVPSDAQIEASFMAKQAQNASKDYPVKQ
jgi:hypothetical protein